MSLSAKLESLARIHGRYQRAGRVHKTRILDEFCSYPAGLRAGLNRPKAGLQTRPGREAVQVGRVRFSTSTPPRELPILNLEQPARPVRVPGTHPDAP